MKQWFGVFLLLVFLSSFATAQVTTTPKTTRYNADYAGPEKEKVDEGTTVWEVGKYVPKGVIRWSQGFEGATFPPEGWAVHALDAGTQTWTRYATTPIFGTASASVRYENSTITNDDWLVTPAFTVNAGDILNFYANGSTGSYDDSLIIYYTTTGGVPPAGYTRITGVLPKATAMFQVSIASLVGQNIRIAFHYKELNELRSRLDSVFVETPVDKDVAVKSIDVPSMMLAAATTPMVTFKNAGAITQSFNVTLKIASSGYTSTKSITDLAPGAEQQVSFDSWTPAVGTYKLVAYTQLSGDMNPANDTLKKDVSAFDVAWTTVAPSPNALSRSCVAMVTINNVDYVYQFGGGSGTQLNSVARYNVSTNTWDNTSFAPMPAGISAGTAIPAGGFIYVFGGESTTGLGKAQKYDYINNQWTALTDMPLPITDALIAKYDEGHIYIIGGGDGLFSPTPTVVKSEVHIYDIATNTYTPATPYPVAADMMGGGIINNVIIAAGGWNGTAAIANAYKGIINVNDLTQINWVQIADYPAGAITRTASHMVSKVKGAGVFFAGGAVGGSTLTTNAYFYNYCGGVWENLPPLPLARSNFKAAGKCDNVGYAVAGYTTAGVGQTDKISFNAIAGTCYDPVPVELTAFTANINGTAVLLNWQTATETNNRGFDIQRKSGNEFINLGFVNGMGTTADKHDYSFSDRNLQPGTYTYRLRQMDMDGSVSYSSEVTVKISIPKVYSLGQNYPNPFNPATMISYSVPQDANVSLKVFDMLGQEVATLVNGRISAGDYQNSFNASGLNSGIYIYKMEAKGIDGSAFSSVRKMILIK